eukprot:2849816-Amphidinium_carterae.1
MLASQELAKRIEGRLAEQSVTASAASCGQRPARPFRLPTPQTVGRTHDATAPMDMSPSKLDHNPNRCNRCELAIVYPLAACVFVH